MTTCSVFLFGTDYIIVTPLSESIKLLGSIEKQQIEKTLSLSHC